MGTEAPKPPVAVRIVRPYKTEDEFVKAELETVTRTGVVLLGAQQRPQGVVLRFEITLSSGDVLVRGEGRVVGYKPAAHGDLPGLTLRFTRLDTKSKQLVDRIAAIREERARVALQASMGESSMPPPRASDVPAPTAIPVVTMPSVERSAHPGPLATMPAPPPRPISVAPGAGTPMGPPVRIISTEARIPNVAPPTDGEDTREYDVPVPMPPAARARSESQAGSAAPPPLPRPSAPPVQPSVDAVAEHAPPASLRRAPSTASLIASPAGRDPALQRLRERAKRISAGDLARIREQGERLRSSRN